MTKHTEQKENAGFCVKKTLKKGKLDAKKVRILLLQSRWDMAVFVKRQR